MSGFATSFVCFSFHSMMKLTDATSYLVLLLLSFSQVTTSFLFPNLGFSHAYLRTNLTTRRLSSIAIASFLSNNNEHRRQNWWCGFGKWATSLPTQPPRDARWACLGDYCTCIRVFFNIYLLIVSSFKLRRRDVFLTLGFSVLWLQPPTHSLFTPFFPIRILCARSTHG